MKITAQHKSQRGFTLIELLVVIGILAILLAITLIAINPAHQFAQANNTKRRSDILQILNAYGQWIAENKGNLPTDLSKSMAAKELSAANFPNACAELVSGTPAYIPALPTDPSKNTTDVDAAKCTAGGWDTGYTVALDANGRITVDAPLADEGASISVTR